MVVSSSFRFLVGTGSAASTAACGFVDEHLVDEHVDEHTTADVAMHLDGSTVLCVVCKRAGGLVSSDHHIVCG